MGRDSWTVLGARSDLPMRGDCLGPRDARREARPTIFLAELNMTREVLTGEVATGVDTTPAAGREGIRIKIQKLYKLWMHKTDLPGQLVMKLSDTSLTLRHLGWR